MWVDPMGLWRIGDSLPQGVVNTAAGLGDGVLGGISFGIIDSRRIRRTLGIDAGIDPCSGLYNAAYFVGETFAPNPAGKAAAVGKAGRLGKNLHLKSGGYPVKSSRAANINAQAALKSKLSGLENAQKKAVIERQLPDGRIRYYSKETPAATKGPTRGRAFVTEYNPKNGNTRQWMESYDHAGNVNRVHPKSMNGQQVKSQHYPPTGKELGL